MPATMREVAIVRAMAHLRNSILPASREAKVHDRGFWKFLEGMAILTHYIREFEITPEELEMDEREMSLLTHMAKSSLSAAKSWDLLQKIRKDAGD